MGRVRPANGHRIRTVAVLLLLVTASALWAACSRRTGAPAAPPPTHAAGAPGPEEHESAGAAPAPADRTEVQRGYASWYGAALAGHRTANGERFDPSKLTAAHRSLPLGTWVEVRRADGPPASVRVRITDRGPFGHADRIIDVSRAAADRLGIRKSGLALVEVRVVQGP